MEMTTGDVDYTALLSLLLSTVEPNDKDTAYSELTQAVDLAAQLLRDDAWAVSGNDRILHYALEQDAWPPTSPSPSPCGEMTYPPMTCP